MRKNHNYIYHNITINQLQSHDYYI